MSGDKQVSGFMSFGDFLALMDLPPATREQIYRRGYTDGYVAALQDMAKVVGLEATPAPLWDFWEYDVIG